MVYVLKLLILVEGEPGEDESRLKAKNTIEGKASDPRRPWHTIQFQPGQVVHAMCVLIETTHGGIPWLEAIWLE